MQYPFFDFRFQSAPNAGVTSAYPNNPGYQTDRSYYSSLPAMYLYNPNGSSGYIDPSALAGNRATTQAYEPTWEDVRSSSYDTAPGLTSSTRLVSYNAPSPLVPYSQKSIDYLSGRGVNMYGPLNPYSYRNPQSVASGVPITYANKQASPSWGESGNSWNPANTWGYSGEVS